MFIPSLAFTKKHLFMSFRSLMQMVVILMERRLICLEQRRSSWRQLRKWWTNGMIMETWVSLPILVSRLLDVVSLSLIIHDIDANHAMYLLMGREIVSCWKSNIYPRIIFVSSSLPSAESLWRVAMLWQGIGSLLVTHHKHTSIARRGAALWSV